MARFIQSAMPFVATLFAFIFLFVIFLGIAGGY